MRKKKSTAQRVRELIDQGYTTKAIVDKLKVKPQIVYNMRYQINKERGLGAIGKPAPQPTEGIGTPPKVTRTHEAAAEPEGTGIAVAAEPPTVAPMPTLWQRVKSFFAGARA